MISKVRAITKRKCVDLCRDKEKRGYECVKKIHKVMIPYKHFSKRNKYLASTYDEYWEAIYKR
ncbi:hypothetical protein SAMN05216389_1267 [Oceanobacillus limi]|uniref:Uncharacterized protein n=1 Tax=Oceanobacillus limi TaxID=930131 RepID=A0A1I0GYX2_9BACI|nr:hypothetical protein SAMN05216389_1267 [Oceanobacillus limi]